MPSRSDKRKKVLHEALASFPLFVDYSIKPSLHNIKVLKKTNPAKMKNPVLSFVVQRAMNHVVERFVIEVVQAWEILNSELKRIGKRSLGVSNKDFKHLKKIRNKLVAHKMENHIKTDRYAKWYKKNYGSYEAVLGLILRIAERIKEKIYYLEDLDLIEYSSVSHKGVVEFSEKDVQDLLNALKQNGIY